MSAFDTFVMVDWSGGVGKSATPQADAIWACVGCCGVAEKPVYLCNRQLAEEWLTDLFETELAAGRRVMAGFDFPFGYPTGFARALTGQDDPLGVWEWFAARVQDAPKSNNRFDIAGGINLTLGQGKGPFWGNARPNHDIKGLPRTKDGYANPFVDKRQCETQAKGTFTCWQLAGAGAVGSQMIMGLPVLERLRKRFAGQVSVWPFETLDTPIALVEIWPSLTVGPVLDGSIKDAWQVAEVVRQVSALDPASLARMLDVSAPEEGWIFGLGFEDELMAAAPLRNDCFALPRGVHWTPSGEALDMLKARMKTVVGQQAMVADKAQHRTLAVDVVAARSNPPLPNTAVDGFGFAGGRGPGAHALPLVTGRAAAGDVPAQVRAGHAIRVLTGAALPSGVDTVVLQEDVQIDAGALRFTGPIKAGANTRAAGEDVSAGDILLARGRVVTPADLALLAATGVSKISVFRQLKVGVLSTGDELVTAEGRAAAHQIYDANRPMLLGMAAAWGFDAVDLGRAPDDQAALEKSLNGAAQKVDVIVTSGGASAGDEDHLSALLMAKGAMDLWRIAIKPGRPLALGMWDGVPVFGLPGNPVAAMVCALIFARPAMAVLAGQDWPTPLGFEVPAAFTKAKKPGRREYLRARIRQGRAEVFPSEGSGRISGLSWAEGLVELDEAAAQISPGDPVRFVPWGSFGL